MHMLDKTELHLVRDIRPIPIQNIKACSDLRLQSLAAGGAQPPHTADLSTAGPGYKFHCIAVTAGLVVPAVCLTFFAVLCP